MSISFRRLHTDRDDPILQATFVPALPSLRLRHRLYGRSPADAASRAPPDAWHAGKGYGSDHTMSMIVFKKNGGRNITCTYEIDKQYSEPDVVI